MTAVSNTLVFAQFSDGTLDSDFKPTYYDNSSESSNLMIELPDGKTLITGKITIDGVVRFIARLNPDGSIDDSFNAPSASFSSIVCMVVQDSGKIVIGGVFQGYIDDVNGRHYRKYIARLNADGSVDKDFAYLESGNSTPFLDDDIFSMAQQSNGKILVGGDFRTVDGVSRVAVARLNENGDLDKSFHATSITTSNDVNAIFVQPDNKIIINQEIRSFSAVQSNVFRLESDGSLDSNDEFKSGHTGMRVKFILGASDGGFLVGGEGRGNYGALQKLGSNGELDTDFKLSEGPNTIYSIAQQADGKLLVAGYFPIQGSLRNLKKVYRYKADGNLDDSFLPVKTGVIGQVYNVLLQKNGGVILTGEFNEINSENHQDLARLSSSDLTNDLKVSHKDEGEIKLRWNAVAGVENYLIYKCLVNQKICSNFFFTKETYYKDTVVDTSKDYFYTVYACNANRDNCQIISDTQERLSLVDKFESNDTWRQANPVNQSVNQVHSFHVAADQDWVKLTVKEAQTVTITTSGSVDKDTKMYLYKSADMSRYDYDNPKETASAFNDNYNGSGYSRIKEKLGVGIYYLLIKQANEDTPAIYRVVPEYKLAIQYEKKPDTIKPIKKASPMAPILYLLSEDSILIEE